MTVTPGISIADGNLMVLGKRILSNVHGNITLTPASGVGMVNGAFLGAKSDQSKSHHVFPIGALEGLRFMCCFRFKLWWMTQRMGTCGNDIPFETQFLIVEGSDGSPLSTSMADGIGEQTVYAVFLPLLEESFRAVLQGNENNELEFCLESGELVRLPKGVALPITLKSREYEVFTIVPVKELANGTSFAPIGLIRMFNSGGAINALEFDANAAVVNLKVRGCGDFGVYCSTKPEKISVDSTETEFIYDAESGLATFTLRVPDRELYVWDVKIEV